MGLSAKTVILESLSRPECADGLPVQALARHAQIFDINESSVRVTLARLRSEGLIEAPARGLYRLGKRAAPIQESVREWRHIEAQLVAWDGSYLAAHVARLSQADRPTKRARERALRLFGFQALAPGLMVRPNNLAAGVAGVRARLVALGLEEEAPVFVLSGLSARDDARARSLWDGEAISAGYEELARQLDDSAQSVCHRPLREAVYETFMLGREAIRTLVLAPKLPEPLERTEARVALADAMRRYDEVGFRLWAAYLDISVQEK